MKLNKFSFILFFTGILTFFLLFGSCLQEGREIKLHVSVSTAGAKKNTEQLPAIINIFIDGKPVVENRDIKGKPFIIEQQLSRGSHVILVTEKSTGAETQTTVNLSRESWFGVSFYREGKGMGYFNTKLQYEPLGKEKAPYGVKSVKNNKDKKAIKPLEAEDSLDKQFDEMKKKKAQATQ